MKKIKAMDQTKILDILEDSKGYDAALMTTFNFDVDFFEKAILGRLIRNSIKRISVFVDAKELAKAVLSGDASSLGRRYSMNPVFMQGSFHPKILLLLGEKKARLLVGSANLTLSGYYVNNEVFNCIDYDSDNSEYRDLIYEAMSFFQSMHQDVSHTYQLDNSLLSELNRFRYYRPGISNGRVFLIHNLYRSVFDQIQEIMTGQVVREMRIAVPYYDDGLAALGELQKAFKDASTHLYLQQQKSTFPEEVFLSRHSSEKLHIFDKVLAHEKENVHFYHGKTFLFKTDIASYILYGSSNCTKSALSRTIKDGNVECNLMVKGTVNEFDTFFANFIDADSEEISSHLMYYEPASKDNFYFMYGIADDTIELHIGQHKKVSSPIFYLDDTALNFREEAGSIILSIDAVDRPVFDLQVKYAGKTETIRCWFNDSRALKLFRADTIEEASIVDREDYAIGDKFKDEYEKLLRAELTTVEDIEAMERVNRSVLQPAGGIENDSAEPDEEDFIVHVDISDEDFAAYQRFKTVEHIRGRIRNRVINGLSIPAFYRNTTGQRDKEADDTGVKTVTRRRKATSEEKRFERFVKRKARSYYVDQRKPDKQKQLFIDRLTYVHYLSIITTIFEIIRKNRINDELVEDIFVDNYVIPTQINLLMSLIDKYDGSSESSDEQDDLIRFAFATLLDNHVRIERCSTQEEKDYYEMQNRKLLRKLEEKFSLRNGYDKYLLELDRGVYTTEAQDRYKGAKEYIESLYGYKGLAQIQEYLVAHYGEKSTFEVSRSSAKIIIHTNKPENHLKPDETLVREISKYSINVGRLTTVRIFVVGMSWCKIQKIEHTINLNRHELSTDVYRANGMNSYGKPRYYRF